MVSHALSKTNPSKTNPSDWLGLDVAKQAFKAALGRAGQKWPATALRDLPVREFERSREGLAALMAWLETLLPESSDAYNVRVVMESTGKYSAELAVWMYEDYPHFRPAIVNPQQTNAYIKSMNVRQQTDAMEARALAFYGLEREPDAYEPLRPEQAQLRELTRHRSSLVDQKQALLNRQGEGTPNKFVAKAQDRLCRTFEREITKVEKEMRALIRDDKQFKHDLKLLTSIYGVAFLTAASILAELGNLRRFVRSRELTAFAGLTPRRKQSGSSVNKPAHLCKKGNGRVRKALYMAALTAVNDNGPMQATYVSLCARGKQKKVALGAVMRKLLVLMRAIVISGQTYDRQWKHRGKLHTTAQKNEETP
ncbi:MAG: transposase [Candidatus Hydrogenedentota bacterium]